MSFRFVLCRFSVFVLSFGRFVGLLVCFYCFVFVFVLESSKYLCSLFSLFLNSVSCRELGYDMALDWDIARNSIEPKKVLMKNVICKGDENILENCKYETGNSTSDCAKQGVSVQCVREGKTLFHSFY